MLIADLQGNVTEQEGRILKQTDQDSWSVKV